MNFTYDLFNRIEPIQIILCKNNLEKVGVLGLAFDKKATLRLTDLSEFSFTYPQKVDNQATPYYNDIKTKKIIYIPELGYFKLEKVKTESDGIKEYKNCNAYSIQIELKNKLLVNFSGTYKLYDVLKPQESLMGILIDYFPNWNIDVIDSSLWSIYRTFDISSKDIYSFIMDELMTSYNCVVLFNIQSRKISVKALENVSKQTDIYISFDNLIKSVEIEELSDEVCTALTVKGGTENTDVRSVNPNGTDIIYNFSYYKTEEWMSSSLITALNTYEIKYNNLKTTYASKLTSLKTKNTTLITKDGEITDLNNEMDALIEVKKVKIQQGLSLTDINTQISSKQSQINTKQNEINQLKSEINTLQNDLNNIANQLKFENNFTTEQLKELDTFIIIQSFQDSTFVVTDNLDEVQKQSIIQELYDYASNVLTRVSQPRFSFSISSANFVFLKDYEKFAQSLELGCLITTELREDYIVTPILLEIEIDFEKDDNFNLRFGNRYKLSDGTFSLADLMSSASNASTTLSLDKQMYKDWEKNSKDAVTTFIEGSLNASVNNIKSTTNQDILIDQHGIRGRQFDTNTNQFSPDMMWMTNNSLAFSTDSFNTARMCVGRVNDSRYGSIYGVNGEVLIGRLLAGNNLRIENSANQFTLDETGCQLVNASFTLTTTDNKSKAILTPSSFKFQGNVGGTWTDQLYFSNGSMKIKGELVAGSIVSNSSITGGTIAIGSSNNIFKADSNGIYLGNAAYSSAPFRVSMTGELYAQNAYINGDIESSSISGSSISSSTITGGTLRTASSGPRIEITSNGIKSYITGSTLHGLYYVPSDAQAKFALYYNGSSHFSIFRNDIATYFTSQNDDFMYIYYHNDRVMQPYQTWDCSHAKFTGLKDLSGGYYATESYVDNYVQQNIVIRFA